eukprot:TRINITY_DN8791_c0_g1_i8.p2 TRINITY_DN8791_c0_g1~~TRINITY_DN8791_c0_g1_i8.p2  ORF type:complete len:204 (-),score=-10.96 TRINITY_DN8791_c0_g1_i8:90-701(-)
MFRKNLNLQPVSITFLQQLCFCTPLLLVTPLLFQTYCWFEYRYRRFKQSNEETMLINVTIIVRQLLQWVIFRQFVHYQCLVDRTFVVINNQIQEAVVHQLQQFVFKDGFVVNILNNRIGYKISRRETGTCSMFVMHNRGRLRQDLLLQITTRHSFIFVQYCISVQFYSFNSRHIAFFLAGLVFYWGFYQRCNHYRGFIVSGND